MAAVDGMILFLKTEVSERCFMHSLSTMETAVKIAERFAADKDKCAVAGLLHDCAKNISGSNALKMCIKYSIEPDYIMRKHTVLLHGYIGSHIAAERFGIEDADILNAIANHTMGRPEMTVLEKIIFLSDYIEPHRSFPGVGKLRKMTYENLDKAIIYAIDGTIKNILSKGDLLHPRILDTRNYYILKQGDTDGIKEADGKDRKPAK